jgi:rubredoxin
MDTYCGYIFGGKLGGAERALTPGTLLERCSWDFLGLCRRSGLLVRSYHRFFIRPYH